MDLVIPYLGVVFLLETVVWFISAHGTYSSGCQWCWIYLKVQDCVGRYLLPVCTTVRWRQKHEENSFWRQQGVLAVGGAWKQEEYTSLQQRWAKFKAGFHWELSCNLLYPLAVPSLGKSQGHISAPQQSWKGEEARGLLWRRWRLISFSARVATAPRWSNALVPPLACTAHSVLRALVL